MTNLGFFLRGLGWDKRRCGTVENLVKFSEDLGEFDSRDGRGRGSKSWEETIGLVSVPELR